MGERVLPRPQQQDTSTVAPELGHRWCKRCNGYPASVTNEQVTLAVKSLCGLHKALPRPDRVVEALPMCVVCDDYDAHNRCPNGHVLRSEEG